MPRRIDELWQYHILSSVSKLILDPVEQRLRFDNQGMPQSDMDKSAPELNNLELIPLAEVFSTSALPRDDIPALICTEGHRGSSSWSIVFIIDERNIKEINSALVSEIPFPWPDELSLDSRPYLFGKHLWKLSRSEEFLQKDELRLVFLETLDKERRKFEKLKGKFSGLAGDPISRDRRPIREEVRIFVWRRDQGRCVKCGSQQKLEFDHIIPISEGGSDTERNIQLLCESCNREKSAGIY